MNSESAKELLNGGIQRWFADTARGNSKVCALVLVTSGARFNIRRQSLALAGPPISAKNRGDALIRDRALNQANTVIILFRNLRMCLKIPGNLDLSRK